MTIAQFLLSSPAASFAWGDNLRAASAKNNARGYEVGNALKKDGGKKFVRGSLLTKDSPGESGGFIYVQSNNTGLFRGAQTGGTNTDLARRQGSNGDLVDHSETRERLEGAVYDMATAMLMRHDSGMAEIKNRSEGIEKVYKLEKGKIERNSTLTDKQRTRQLTELDKKYDELRRKNNDVEPSELKKRLEEEYFISTKEQMSRFERATGVDKASQPEILSWVREQYNEKQWSAAANIEDLVARITNRVKNLELKADIAFSKAYYKLFGRYPYKVTTLCLGEKKSQYDPNDPTKAWKILERDARQMLAGISRKDAEIIGLRFAYEPRWVIGADTIPADVLAKINETHGFLKKISRELLGVELAVDYGAAVKATTIESILALENVDGVLIGGAANDPATLKPIIEKAVEYVRNHPEKKFNLGINWKANDTENGLKELDVFVAMLKSISDLDLITVTIATPNVRDTRTAMDKVEKYFSKASLNSLEQTVERTEVLGNGIEVEYLNAASKGPRFRIESYFGEETRQGDTYMRLKKDGIVFGLAKGNNLDQTLMTVPVDDMTDIKEKDAYYAALLETASLMTTKTGKAVELIEEKGDRLKSYLSRSTQKKAKLENLSLGTLSGTKYWYGRERFFQLEYKPAGTGRDVRSTMLTAKPTERALARGTSFIIQPTYYVLVNGYGTIGAKAAAAARKSGFFVMATARSVKIDSRDAFLKDYPLVLSETKNAADFKANGMQVAGEMMDVLGITDFVIDATPAKVGAENIKNYYSKFPHLRVILEGGEKAAEGIKSFSSGTNYEAVLDSIIARIVSCNTTAMARTYGKVVEEEEFSDLVIANVIMRRAADPGDEKGENPDGISILPVSHHGDDFLAVLSDSAKANIKSLRTTAVVTPTTHFHVHSGTIRGRGVTAAKVQAIFKAQSRVALVQFPGGELKTPVLFDIFNSMIKDANHPFIVVAQVEESGNPDEVAITIAVPQESNVVPENVNALQSMSGLWNQDAAIRIVNEVLDILRIKDELEKRLPANALKDGGIISDYINKRKIENAISSLGSKDKFARCDAAKYLLNIYGDSENWHERRILDAVIEALRKEHDNYVKIEIINGLQRFPGEKTAIEDFMVQALDDDSMEVRQAGLRILIALGSSKAVSRAISVAQNDVYDDVRRKAVDYLANFPDERSVDTLIHIIEHDSVESIVNKAIEAVSKINNQRVSEFLVALAKNPTESFDVRMSAVKGLSGFKNYSGFVVPELSGLLNGYVFVHSDKESFRIQKAIIDTLGELNDSSAEDAILSILQKKPDLEWNCLDSLMKIGTGKSIDQLISIVKDRERTYYPRKTAIKVLEKLNAQIVADDLIVILQDPKENVDVQAQAAITLGEFRYIKAVEPLMRTMANYVKSGRTGYRSEDIAAEVRASCAKALGTIRDPRAKEHLYQVSLHDRDRDVRIEAMVALLEMGDTRQAQALKDVLSNESVYYYGKARERITNALVKNGIEVPQDSRPTKDGGEAEVVIPMDYLTLDDVDVRGKTVLYRGDFNSPVAYVDDPDNPGQKKAVLSVTERMRADAVTLRELKEKGARVGIMIHQGRKKKGKPDADYLDNLQQYSELMSDLIGAPIGYTDDLYGKYAVNAIKSLKDGEMTLLKNARSWDLETKEDMTLQQQADSEMVRALAPWIDFEVLDAFSIAHRNNISVVGFQAAGVPLIAGRLMEKEIKGNYRAALVGEKPFIASFGGAKIDDYLGVIRKGLKEGTYSKVHMSGLLGELALIAQGYNLGKPTIDFLAEQFKDFSDEKYGIGMQGMVNAIKKLLDTYGDRIEIPVDVAYLDADGRRVETVLTDEHKNQGELPGKPAADTLIGDIGTETAKKYSQQIKEAKTVFVKGPWGNYKNYEFMAASKIIAEALNESAAYLITGGGDTNVLFERLGMTDRINYFSLAGGAFLEFMEGKALPGLVALDRSAKEIISNAQKLNVSKVEYLKHVINDRLLYRRQPGGSLKNLVGDILKIKAPMKGELSDAQWSAEVITDSRGKPTVKVTLRIGDIEVEGFVPAGTSTGEDEANTVDPQQAVRNILEKIGPMLAASRLDLGRHEDLVRADRMLQEAAGENFKDLGANATLPVSWALWKMAAKLHNKPLWLYFRMYEPRAVGKGLVYNYYNFGNGGEHSMQDKSERLGIDRMAFQELKLVTISALTDRESLAQADLVDQIYKRKLIEVAGARNVTRALERGLTAKGIADPYVMLDLLIQAAIEAGLKPGVDFKIALDIAANSFYNVDTKLYFISPDKQFTAPQMSKYVIDFADHFRNKYHPDIFTSFEDPLAENEWDETAILTKELKDRGILLLGDDLYVTQIRRVSIGVEKGAGTAILIKPNQNGTIIGTIDTAEYGLNNGMEEVASHRSGETRDKALADLATGFRMFAIKTGAPQPESEYPNPEEWERRNKYLRKIEIQENESVLQKALIIGPEFFASGGSMSALKQALELNKEVTVVLYGPAAESIKTLLADKSIFTSETLTGAVAMLKSFDFHSQSMVILGSVPQEDADAVKDIKQIPINGIGTIALAQALNALLSDETTQAAFAVFDKSMADFKVDEAVSADVDQALREEEEFFNKV